MSLRAYGRHRQAKGLPGGSAVAVSRAIQAQRLTASVVSVDGQAQIANADLADQEWARNTDHSRAPSTVKAKGESVTPPQTVTPVTDEGVTPPAQAPSKRPAKRGNTLAEASTREKNAKADLAELEFKEKTGELVPAQAVQDSWGQTAAQIRAAILSVPSKAKTLMPHLTHADLAQLNDLLCQTLETLADAAGAGPEAGAPA